MAYNGFGFAMCGLCAKYFQPHIAKPLVVRQYIFLTRQTRLEKPY